MVNEAVFSGKAETDPVLKIGLVQINNSFSGQSYLPYSVALLQSYISRHHPAPQTVQFLLPIFSRMNVDVAVDKLSEADLVFFSSYVWNICISSEIARRLRERHPRIGIVFGGPQVPDRAEQFLREHPFIDLVVHGEGEKVALEIVQAWKDKDWNRLAGVSFLTADGQFHHKLKGERIKDINVVPSPFLTGIFDAVMQAHPNQKWIALWETNRGCPFSCTFCDWGSSTQSRVFQFGLDRLKQEADWFADKKIDFVFCCDANFGILPRDVDIAQYVADVKRAKGSPSALSVQNTKNATERAYLVQKILSDSGLNKGVTIAMQSVDKATLKNIKRDNISLASYQELQRRFTRDRVETYTDLILGLPGETYESFKTGIATVIENGQHNRIQFNNCSILPNAEMGDPEYQRKHGIVTIESDIINIHGSLADADNEILEKQQLVIATATTPREDWVRTRAYCWMVALLHFDKVFQIPIILTHELAGISYAKIFDLFGESNLHDCPTLNEVREFFFAKARDIQNGGAEFCHSPEYLNIFWPADELALIRLIADNKIEAFYAEAFSILKRVLVPEFASLLPALEDAVRLNRNLLKLPFQTEDLDVTLRYNIWEFYRAALRGETIPLIEKPVTCHVDRTSQAYWTWDDFCREVIWYGNKKGAYLYTNREVEPQIAGIY
ncbi:MAG TPA: cobalamin-dependent protein [Candidatus Saccharimonadales bacterium]|nr:cobalamin-dependent protein [Candidatus Saccharimonadales bacterium]